MSSTPTQPDASDASEAGPSVGPLGKLNLPAWLAAVCALAAVVLPWLGFDWPLPLLLAPLAIFFGIIARGLGSRGAAFAPVGTISSAFGLLAVLLIFVWVNVSGLGLGPYADRPANPEDDEPIETYTDPDRDPQSSGPQPATLDLGNDIPR